MNSSGPLRRTPLERRTPLQRGGPLVRHAPLQSRRNTTNRLPVVQEAEVLDGIGEDIAKIRVAARSGGWCEIQLPGCFRRAVDWHHRLRNGQGGLWQASNGLHACRRCHDMVTNTNGRRVEYEANGWLIAAWQVSVERPVWRVPGEVSVLLAGVGRVRLDDGGRFELVLGDAA